jgi:GT2 family glycosyltransferase
MKLSIIILNYNTKALLAKTIGSIKPQADREIIIVDNGSTDGSVEYIKQKFPKCQLIELPQNLGYAAGNNRGLALAQGQYVMLLNSDALIINDALDTLLAYLDKHPQVGAITPKVVLPNGAIDLACHRGMPTPWNAFAYFSKLEQLFPHSAFFAGYHQTYKDFNTTHQIDATAGTAMIVRRLVIDQIGLLDEQFFLYAEDLDWCKRITEAGYKIIYFPKAEVLHLKSQSGKKHLHNKKVKRESHRHFYDTMKQFYQKHYANHYPWPIRKLVMAAIDLKKWWAVR